MHTSILMNPVSSRSKLGLRLWWLCSKMCSVGCVLLAGKSSGCRRTGISCKEQHYCAVLLNLYNTAEDCVWSCCQRPRLLTLPHMHKHTLILRLMYRRGNKSSIHHTDITKCLSFLNLHHHHVLLRHLAKQYIFMLTQKANTNDPSQTTHTQYEMLIIHVKGKKNRNHVYTKLLYNKQIIGYRNYLLNY